jgi:hypothetical protein
LVAGKPSAGVQSCFFAADGFEPMRTSA